MKRGIYSKNGGCYGGVDEVGGGGWCGEEKMKYREGNVVERGR